MTDLLFQIIGKLNPTVVKAIVALVFVLSIVFGIRKRRRNRKAKPAGMRLVYGAWAVFAVYLLATIFFFDLYGVLWFGMILIGLCLELALLVIMALAIIWVFSAPTTRRRRIAVVVLLLSYLLVRWQSWNIGRCSYLFRNIATYQLVIEKAAAGTITESGETPNSTCYYVDPGPPIRVAFPWPGGIIDNWYGAVFDPSGEVMEVNKFERDFSNWQEPSLQGTKKLFGGHLHYAEHLYGSWYLCYFT